MQTILRLEELRKEVGEIDRDLAELGARKAELEETLSEANEATDKNLIDRYRAGEPVRLGDLEAKTKNLESELAVVQATIEAMQKHKDVLMPELNELEGAQRLAEGWHSVGVLFIAARVLNGQWQEMVRQAAEKAPVRKFQNALGYEVTRRSIPRSVGGHLPFFVGRLDHEAIKAAHRIDPGRFPRIEQVDLTITDRGFGYDNRGSRRKDRRILNLIWEDLLQVQQHLLEEYGVDIGVSEEEIEAKIKEVLPK